MVDAGLLHETFAATLVPNGETSRQAAQQLAVLESQPQFVTALLRIIVEPEANFGVRQASAIYLKNKVYRSWPLKSTDPLSDSDRLDFKEQLLPAIVVSPPALRSLLLVSLGTVLCDFQNGDWPEFLPSLSELLQSNSDLPRVACGLSILRQLCLFYRWNVKSVSAKLEPLMQNVFPLVLQLAEAATAELQAGSIDEVYYQIVYEVLKIYKLSTVRFLPSIMRGPGFAKRSIELFLHIFLLPLPANVLQTQPADERTHLLPVKCQKWSVVNVSRTYSAYATTRFIEIGENGGDYIPFRSQFNNEFAPELTQIYINQLLEWSAKRVWYSSQTLFHLLSFLESVLDLKTIFTNVIEPQLPMLVSQILFPLLCPSEEDFELFVDEPPEWMQQKLANGSDFHYTPGLIAAELLRKIVKKYKHTLGLVVQFLQECAQSVQGQTGVNDDVKCGMLVLTQALSPVLLSKSHPELREKMPQFVTEFIFPYLWSENAYLRAESCYTVHKFAPLTYGSRDVLQQLFQGVLNCFFDQKHLPVQVIAVQSLQALSAQPQNADVRAALSDHLTSIFTQLLQITAHMDSEPLLLVLDHFVEQFADMISPFAVSLAQQLTEKFSALVTELDQEEDGNDKPDHLFNEPSSDKLYTCIGIINSLANLQASLENNAELTHELDVVISPIFHAVYHQRLADFFQETMSLHENIIFTLKQVPQHHWAFFDELLELLDGTEDEYVHFVQTVLENYITYGAVDMGVERVSKLVHVLKALYEPTKPGSNCSPETDIGVAFCELGTRNIAMSVTAALLESKPISSIIQPHIRALVEAVLLRIAVDKSDEEKPRQYILSTNSVVLAALYCSPSETFNVLISNGALHSYFEYWIASCDSLRSVNALKLSLVAVLSVLEFYASTPQVTPQYIAPLFNMLARSLELLPAASLRWAQYLKAEQDAWADPSFDDYDEEDDEETDASAAFEQEVDSSNFIYETPEETSLFTPELDDATYLVTPLDVLNPYDALRASITQIQGNGNFYNELMQSAPESEKAVIVDSLQIEKLPGEE